MLFILLLGLAFAETCKEKSVLSGDKCVAPQTIVDGCLVLENQEQKTCKECTEGMQKTDKAACVAGTIENCIYYNGTECTLCDKGFGIKKDDKNVQTCVACPSGSNYCEFDGENEKNKLCYGSFDKDGKCISKVSITNCLEQISTNISGTVKNKCNKCDNYAKPNEDNTECWKIDHCINVKSKNECVTCADYYNLTEAKDACNGIEIQHCITVDQEDVKLCSKCDEKYYVSSDKKSCLAYNITNCQVQTSEKVCQTCNKYYYLNNTAKTEDPANQCQLKIEYCTSFDSNNGECKECEGEHYVSSDKKSCLDYNITNCQKQTSEKVCQKCKDYYNITQENDACNEFEIQNCIRVDSTDVKLCGACKENYYVSVDKKSCLAYNITNCQTQISEKVCQTCKDYYNLTETNDACNKITIEHCIRVDTDVKLCGACETGYERSEDKKQCNKKPETGNCEEHCRYCDETGNYCYDCLQDLSDLQVTVPEINATEFETLVQKQDFYVLTNDKCVRRSLIVNVNDDNNDGSNNNNISSSRGFVTMISLIFFIFVLF